MSSSTANGWEPIEGQLVVLRMWEPTKPSWQATLSERIAGGVRYSTDRVMRLARIVRNADANAYPRSMGVDLPVRLVTRWILVDPDRPNDESRNSWVDSDWAELLQSGVEEVVDVPLF